MKAEVKAFRSGDVLLHLWDHDCIELQLGMKHEQAAKLSEALARQASIASTARELRADDLTEAEARWVAAFREAAQ